MGDRSGLFRHEVVFKPDFGRRVAFFSFVFLLLAATLAVTLALALATTLAVAAFRFRLFDVFDVMELGGPAGRLRFSHHGLQEAGDRRLGRRMGCDGHFIAFHKAAQNAFAFLQNRFQGLGRLLGNVVCRADDVLHFFRAGK